MYCQLCYYCMYVVVALMCLCDMFICMSIKECYLCGLCSLNEHDSAGKFILVEVIKYLKGGCTIILSTLLLIYLEK